MNKDQALLDTIIKQRNNALNESATLSVNLQEAQERIKELEAELEKKGKPPLEVVHG